MWPQCRSERLHLSSAGLLMMMGLRPSNYHHEQQGQVLHVHPHGASRTCLGHAAGMRTHVGDESRSANEQIVKKVRPDTRSQIPATFPVRHWPQIDSKGASLSCARCLIGGTVEPRNTRWRGCEHERSGEALVVVSCCSRRV